MEDQVIMLINMKELAATGTLGEFCRTLENDISGTREIVFDFKGVNEVHSNDAEALMSTCLRLKERGNIIRLKDMSITIRNQFLLSAINYAQDDILL
ncbi:MAG: hypothetical protein A2176_10140 [Spirochaetes bacterium RBG_13_51_14]|nr:MAG: hypothetical protein A2176_10140 [Spirochaetes bacterium RBG_13_51_14]